jgi:hypothetical protein
MPDKTIHRVKKGIGEARGYVIRAVPVFAWGSRLATTSRHPSQRAAATTWVSIFFMAVLSIVSSQHIARPIIGEFYSIYQFNSNTPYLYFGQAYPLAIGRGGA